MMYKQLEQDLQEVKGDSTLYAGMLAYVGDKEATTYVSRCVDLAGQIWRNPEAADAGRQYVNSCSRDMFMGVLLGGDELAVLTAANYLKLNKGLLCPKATDNRNKVGVMGWAQLGVVLGKEATPAMMGLKGYLLAKLFRPLLGPVALLEALTVYERYQINLVYCALMLYRKHGVARFWEKYILKCIRKIRQEDDMVLWYLEGASGWLEFELPHMDNRRAWALSIQAPIKDWPLDKFTINFPSAAFIRWIKAATHSLKEKQDANL